MTYSKDSPEYKAWQELTVESEKYRVCNHCNLSEIVNGDKLPSGRRENILICSQTGEVMEPWHAGCDCWVDLNLGTYERMVAREQKNI